MESPGFFSWSPSNAYFVTSLELIAFSAGPLFGYDGQFVLELPKMTGN